MKAIYFDTKAMGRILTTIALGKIWRGAPFGPTSPVRSVDEPEPPLPGPEWVRVRNSVCGICASDLHLLLVDVDPMIHPAALPDNDRIYLGHEVVGEVVEQGEAVTATTVGERVLMQSRFLGPTCHSQHIDPPCPTCASGDYSLCMNRSKGLGPTGVGGGWGDSYLCHESEIYRLPEELSDDDGALLEPLACCVRAVLRRPPAQDERVLVLGCGTIGLGCIQVLRAIEPTAEVYAAARYPHQIAAAQSLDATVVEGDLLDAAAEATGALVYEGPFGNRTALGGFDVVYDCVGTGPSLTESLRLCRAGGTVVHVGVHLHRVKLDLTPIWHQELHLIGAMTHGSECWEGERISTFDLTARWLGEGRLTTAGLVTHRFPLAQWREAARTATDKRSGAIKVLLEMA